MFHSPLTTSESNEQREIVPGAGYRDLFFLPAPFEDCNMFTC
jgi:hypothetical protein